MSDNAEVIQGRLGWESGDVSEARVANLEPHPKNREIYGDTDDLDESFVESIREKGVLERLVITPDKQVISGHRRLAAAQQAGVDTVPVRIYEFDDELAEREALVEFNRQREKTPGQIIQEAEELLEIQRQKGKETQGQRTDLSQNSEKGSADHDSWDEVADTVGVSRDTLSKGKTVKDKAESDDEPEPVQEAAKEAWRDLEAGDESFNGAYSHVKDTEREVEEQRERKQRDETRQSKYENAEKTVEIRHGDFRDVLGDAPDGSVDHIVTDPPYDADALELWAALGAHASRVLKPGGFLIAYSGKAHLPKIHELLSTHLNYHWQAIVRHAGPGAKIFSRKLRTNYKPVLIYTNGDADLQDDFISDVIEGGGQEKDDHEWQQAESEAAALIEAFTEVNDRICDPMCGSGTIGVAGDRLNRRCLLIDADRDAVETTREKVVK